MFKLPELMSEGDYPEWTTKGELAAELYPDVTYDTALPQGWVDVTTVDFDPRRNVVWGYPKGSVMGLPLPVTTEARDHLANLGWEYE